MGYHFLLVSFDVSLDALVNGLTLNMAFHSPNTIVAHPNEVIVSCIVIVPIKHLWEVFCLSTRHLHSWIVDSIVVKSPIELSVILLISLFGRKQEDIAYHRS